MLDGMPAVFAQPSTCWHPFFKIPEPWQKLAKNASCRITFSVVFDDGKKLKREEL